MHSIFCVVVTFNGKKWVDNCFGSLRASKYKLKTICIDNGSTDGTQEAIKANYPEVDFIRSNENLGFGKANNIGLKRAYASGADYVLLLNQDAWVKPDSINELVKVAEENKDYGIFSPMHLNGQGNALDYNFSNYVIPQRCPNYYSDLYMNTVKSYYQVKFVNAAAWLISRETIEIIGFFDELFFLYGEDKNYIFRLEYHGLKLGIVPSAVIQHDREIRKGSKNSKGLNLRHENKYLQEVLDIKKTNLTKAYLLATFKLLLKVGDGMVSIREFLRISFKMLKLRKSFIKSRRRNKQHHIKKLS